jgi:hypothetical protein
VQIDKEDRNISTSGGHKTQFNLEAYPPSRAKIPLRRPKLDPTLLVHIPSESEEDYEDVGYVQIAYGEVIRSLSMTNGKTFTRYSGFTINLVSYQSMIHVVIL